MAQQRWWARRRDSFKQKTLAFIKQWNLRKLPALCFACKHSCFVCLCCSSSWTDSLLLLLEKGEENLRVAAAPRALLLPGALVFTFQSLKNSGGIHRALMPSRTPGDSQEQKWWWLTAGKSGWGGGHLSSQKLRLSQSSALVSSNCPETTLRLFLICV